MPLQNFASKIPKLSGKIFTKIIFLFFPRMMVLGKNLHTEIISGVSLKLDPSIRAQSIRNLKAVPQSSYTMF